MVIKRWQREALIEDSSQQGGNVPVERIGARRGHRRRDGRVYLIRVIVGTGPAADARVEIVCILENIIGNIVSSVIKTTRGGPTRQKDVVSSVAVNLANQIVSHSIAAICLGGGVGDIGHGTVDGAI